MEAELERLFQEWHRLGGAMLLAQVERGIPARCPEEVIAESTAHCRESGRLTWIVLDWLIRHIDEIDDQRLIQLAAEQGDFSVLGFLCDAARQRRPHPRFDRIIGTCRPYREVTPFFYRVARSPLALRLTQEHPNAVFRRWNYLSSELRYLE